MMRPGEPAWAAVGPSDVNVTMPHSHTTGAAPELLNVDPDDRLNTIFRRTRNQLRLPGERTDRLAIRIEDVPEACRSPCPPRPVDSFGC